MIRFSKYLWLYALISGLVLIPGIFSLVRFGLRPAIDFTGGTLLELSFSRPVAEDVIRSPATSEQIELVSVQKTGEFKLLLRLKPAEEEKLRQFQAGVAEAAGEAPRVVRSETVGPVLGRELLGKTLVAAILAIFGILGYVAWSFRSVRFGTAAVIALFHDLLVVIGSFSLLGYFRGIEVDTLFVTAVLTTMSFSVHDTIVVFDRIRELRKRNETVSLDQLCDRALTETMGRSLANSFTIAFMLLALVLLGGATIRWFAVALLIGTISGTYSSPFVATPILILWDRWGKKKNF